MTAPPPEGSGRPGFSDETRIDGRRATYRVEHRRGDAVAVLGETDDPLARYTVLGSLAARLIDAGAEGMLLLVEQETGDVVARRALHPAQAVHWTGGDVVGTAE
ncbi:MAG: hypothetical protein M3Q10_08580 [Chloroflexota bacterium]|nr:hypothetical protein [Chloroflexota bacterium]